MSRIVYGLIGVNSAVFLSWSFAKYKYQTDRDPRYIMWMDRHFVNTRKSEWYTMITSSFSHENLIHFGINMFVLHSFGPSMIQWMTPRRFPLFYVMSALSSSIASRTQQNKGRGSHGASGVITGLCTTYAILYPKSTILLYGLLPLPTWFAMGGFVAWDVYQSMKGGNGITDSAGHIGGAFAGALFYYMMRRRII